MMASYDWRIRHAGLMAIAAIAEGTGKVLLGRRIQVVGHAGAGKVCRSWISKDGFFQIEYSLVLFESPTKNIAILQPSQNRTFPFPSPIAAIAISPACTPVVTGHH